jgi:hypothetical protein
MIEQAFGSETGCDKDVARRRSVNLSVTEPLLLELLFRF